MTPAAEIRWSQSGSINVMPWFAGVLHANRLLQGLTNLLVLNNHILSVSSLAPLLAKLQQRQLSQHQTLQEGTGLDIGICFWQTLSQCALFLQSDGKAYFTISSSAPCCAVLWDLCLTYSLCSYHTYVMIQLKTSLEEANPGILVH